MYLLDEGVSRARQELERRREDNLKQKTAAAEKNGTAYDAAADPEMQYDLQDAAQKIGYAAIRYFDLKNNRTSNYAFSFDKMLNPNGDTAVYLLYAYARICSIERKTQVDIGTLDPSKDMKIAEQPERDLLLELLKFPDILDNILKDL